MFIRLLMFVAMVLAATGQTVQAQQTLKLPSCFSDHMVLQQQQHAKIWGWAEAGKIVNVGFSGHSINAVADDKGYWSALLPKLAANAVPSKLNISCGGEEVVIEDVLVGEVWFASGQSNMAWNLRNTTDSATEIASADMPGLRMFLAAPTPAKEPQTDIQGAWNVCTPENVPLFSATAYYFAKKIHQETGVPVGVIKSVIGGKRCECYCSREAMMSNENGKEMIAQLDAQSSAYDPEAAQQKYEKSLKAWQAKTEKLRNANRELPKEKRKRMPRKPQKQQPPMMNPGNPTVLYNGMIHPFIGYNMRGAIWYQGESNARANLAPIYQEMFTLMIQDWRTRWNQDFPFYFVQLANFRKATTEPGVDNEWPTIQNQQRLTLDFPYTGMATINDIGEESDIHPKNKKDVGERLARWALKNEYGKDVVVSGPLYEAVTFDNQKAVVEFKHIADGLKSRDGEALKRFEIAGEDRKWHWAQAEIVNNQVVVTCKDVPRPVAVRYAWASNPTGANLVNSEGLPASIFRTDQWKASFEE